MAITRTRAARAAVVLSALALVAACGSEDDPTADETGAGSEPADDGTTDDGTTDDDSTDQETLAISIGSLPIVPTAGLQYGLDNGIFEEHGLDVSIDMGVGSEVMVASVIAGDVDFVTLNSVAAMVATDAGMPIEVVSGFSHSLAADAEADVSAVLVLPDSGISSPADLAGRSIAVNTFNSGGTLTIPEVVREDGGTEPVEFVEIHFPEALPALERGDVDAIWVVEPFITFAQQAGAEVISWNFAETVPGIATQVVVAAADQDPAVTERVVAAMTDVFEQANADPEGLAATLAGMLDMDEGLAAIIVQEHYSTAIDTGSLETYAELALNDGIISEPLDTSTWGGTS